MLGDGNSQYIEILPPRLAGTNKTYTLQVALDGKNFLDVPTVKLTVNNESVKGEGADGMNWVECGKADLFNITATYVDEKTGKEIASPYKAQGYIISEWETYTPSIQAKDIEGYELVSAPDMSQYKGFIGNKKDYNFQFKYRKLGSTDPGGQGEGDGNGSGSGSGNDGNTGNGGQSGSGANGQNGSGSHNKKPDAQNLSATTNKGNVAKTGDTNPILPIAAVAVISLAGVVVVFKKKREVK